jgi:hypothetical protein
VDCEAFSNRSKQVPSHLTPGRSPSTGERLQQTPNQVSGARENVSLSYLRDGDYAGAYSNASEVERTGLFPWSQLVRALSAAHLKTDHAVTVEREARRNVRFFEVRRLNPCE